MQFTTIASLLFAAAAASAAPSLQERQQTTVFAQFYNQDAGCHGPVVEDFVFNQAEGTACTNAPDFPAHQSAFFSQNSLSCTLRIYNNVDCRETGSGANFWDIGPAFTGCQGLTVESWRFIC